MGAPHCKAVLGRKFSVPSQSGPKMAVFWELRGVNVKFLSSEGTSLRGTALFGVLRVKIGSGVWAVGRWKNPKKEAE